MNECIVLLDDTFGMTREEFSRLLEAYLIPCFKYFDEDEARTQYSLITYPDEASWLTGTRDVKTYGPCTVAGFIDIIKSVPLQSQGMFGVLGPALAIAQERLSQDRMEKKHIVFICGTEPSQTPAFVSRNGNEGIPWQQVMKRILSSNIHVSFISPFREPCYVSLLKDMGKNVDAVYEQIHERLRPQVCSDLVYFSSMTNLCLFRPAQLK